MKKNIYILIVALLIATSCKDDDNRVFDKTADERVAEAIANLKNNLITPPEGWRVKYRPEAGSGSFWLLMKFDENNNVTIKSDLSNDEGEFHEQTVTYRIDSSLGLELIIENYSFFSYLFEQDQAGFGAEFEFNYVNKTPEGHLVFSSKSDRGTPTTLLFERASEDDEDLLGTAVAENLNTIAEDINRFSSSYKIVYDDKDLILYASLDPFTRIIRISTSSKKTNTATTKTIDFSSPYIIEGNSILLDKPLTGSFVGVSISITALEFDDLNETTIESCGAPLDIHSYTGETSQGDNFTLEPTLLDANGKRFTSNDYLSGPIQFIFNNGESAAEQVAQDIKGAQQIQLYYNTRLSSGPNLFGIGFFIQNANGTRTFALKEFTPTLIDNNIIFDFKPGFRIFESATTDAVLENINIYLDKLTENDQTFVYEYSEGIYEFYNPCSGWSFVMVAAQ